MLMRLVERKACCEREDVDALWLTAELNDDIRVLEIRSRETKPAEAELLERGNYTFGVYRVSPDPNIEVLRIPRVAPCAASAYPPTIRNRTSWTTNDRKNSWKSGFSCMGPSVMLASQILDSVDAFPHRACDPIAPRLIRLAGSPPGDHTLDRGHT